MKKLLLIFSVVIAASPFLPSCKKLKDDIKDLQNQVSDLKNENDTLKNHNSGLRNRLNGIENLLGSDEPITATTTFEDDNGVTRTISGVYKFKASDYYTQRMLKNENGTYDIYIERFGDIDWGEAAMIEFTYNPATKEVTGLKGYQYWRDVDPYYDQAVYFNDYPGLTYGVTIKSIDVTTGAISLKFSASGTGEYTSAAQEWMSPNPGKPVSSTFTFAGKLRVFDRD